jgi:hypothetical protein
MRPTSRVTRDRRGRVKPTDTDGDGDGSTIGFRTYGKSKDHRDDLPQIVVGMAVTRDEIPFRVWCWPGNTGDAKLIRQVRTGLNPRQLGKIGNHRQEPWNSAHAVHPGSART